jgi:hypothetical protein
MLPLEGTLLEKLRKFEALHPDLRLDMCVLDPNRRDDRRP